MAIDKLDGKHFVPIVSDGGFAHPDIGDGRLIPVLIVDCSKHRQLYELILLQEESPPGDVRVTWGRKMLDKNSVYLRLEFSQPVITKAYFLFNLEKQSGLVDGIIKTRGLYLQPLESGSKVFEGINKPKILVEIPASAKLEEWPDLHRKTVMRLYRKAGASRQEAKELATEHLTRLNELWNRRQKRNPNSNK